MDYNLAFCMDVELNKTTHYKKKKVDIVNVEWKNQEWQKISKEKSGLDLSCRRMERSGGSLRVPAYRPRLLLFLLLISFLI